MYAQLRDNSKSSQVSKSTSPSNAIENDGNKKLNLGSRKKMNTNVELNQSLMDDVEMNGSNSAKSAATINGDSNLRNNDSIPVENGRGQNGNGVHVAENGSSSLMHSDDDPFYVFKDDLQIKLEMLDDGLQRFERIVQVTVSITLSCSC